MLTVKEARDVNVQHGEQVPAGIAIVRAREYNLEGLIELLQGGVNRLLRLFGGELPDKFFREWMAIPDAQIAWLSWWSGMRLARHCSVIYASCSPYSSALSGCIIKLVSGRPLVLDFRDAWTLNPHARHHRWHQRVIERLEQWAFARADHIVLNTEGAKALYSRRYRSFASKMSVIPNGYDRLNIADARALVREPFRIMHVGAFYGTRTPDQLLDALARFEGDVEFVQVGPSHPSLRRYNGSVRIRLAAQMKHADAQALMRTASLLYLRQGWESDVRDYIAVAGKTYEYLATGLPILAHCPPGDNAELIRRYAPESYLVTSQEGRELDAALKAAYNNRWAVAPRVTPDFADAFNRSSLTKRLAQVFDTVAEGGQERSRDRYVQYLHAEWNLHGSDPLRSVAVANTVAHKRVCRVLDAGAGAGQEMQPLIGSGGSLGVAVDISRYAGATGRELYGRYFPSARAAFVRASIETLPFLSQTFDVVICRLALPYADNPTAVKELSRVLMPGATLLVKLHHPRYYVRQLRQSIRAGDPIAAVNAIRVLVNGAVFAMAGNQLRNRWLGRETCQTRPAFLACAERHGLRLVGDLPDSNPHTPSLHLTKT